RHAPTALILTRQKVPILDRQTYAPAEGVGRGAYILAEATDKDNQSLTPQLLLLATGSEVSLALDAREQLQKDGTPTRVVSMPCWELFEEQDQNYRDEVLPPNVTARLSIEAGARLGWDRYIGPHGDAIALDRFGASAPGDVALRELGYNVENVCERARVLLK
ncbi:MAG: transketolase-like TK C-terminal-containing protein, partial [Pyrinomonadaceae bacterium]